MSGAREAMIDLIERIMAGGGLDCRRSAEATADLILAALWVRGFKLVPVAPERAR